MPITPLGWISCDSAQACSVHQIQAVLGPVDQGACSFFVSGKPLGEPSGCYDLFAASGAGGIQQALQDLRLCGG